MATEGRVLHQPHGVLKMELSVDEWRRVLTALRQGGTQGPSPDKKMLTIKDKLVHQFNTTPSEIRS